MLTLRDSGWSVVALAVRFNCDHSSIIYQCNKHKVRIGGKVTMGAKQYLKKLRLEKEKYSAITSENINQGHDYAHYLEKENEKNKIK